MHISDGKYSRWPKLFSEGWTWCSSPLLTAKHWTNGFSIPHSRVSGHLSREQTESLATDSCHPWQWKENTSANDSHLFLPKTTVMGMLLQPHTPGAKTLRQLHQKQNCLKREKKTKKTWVRNHVGTEKICKQFMQSSIAAFLFPLVFFHVGQIPQAPIKKQKCGLMKFINLCYLLPTRSAT